MVEARTPIFSDSYRGHAVRNSYSSPDLRPSHVRALSYKVALASCSRSCGAWVSHGVCALCECTHLPSLDAAVRVPGKEKASRPNLAMDEGSPLRLCVISWLTLWPHALLAHSNLYARSASLLSAGSRGGGRRQCPRRGGEYREIPFSGVQGPSSGVLRSRSGRGAHGSAEHALGRETLNPNALYTSGAEDAFVELGVVAPLEHKGAMHLEVSQARD